MYRLLEAFEHHNLFRRIVLIVMLVQTWAVTLLTYSYVMYATDRSVPGDQIALVAGALQFVVVTAFGYCMHLYDKQRKLDKQREADMKKLNSTEGL